MADQNEMTEGYDGLAIAVIGMAGRFPGARNLDEYWRNLCNGVESISTFTDEELKAAGVSPEELAAPNYVKAAPVLEDVEQFDAGFFGYTPLEARVMDPQQRLLLECGWEALEHAGYDPDKHPEPISVFAGTRTSTYLFHVLAHRAALQPQDRMLVELGNDVSTVATRVSYKLNLKGPAYSVQTACSTSLAAIHLACQSLLMGECRMALAGAAAINVPHRAGYLHDSGSILSPDGHCRPFDAQAQGTVFGSGAGAVVLKRLADALADGDRVLAIVRGTAANNDGSHKASYTAPSVEGQTEVILEALACAGVDADAISYLEAHGTATPLGDPIELLALSNAYRASTDKKGFCRIGTAKSNFGHLDVAAGMAGFIKTVLSLQHRQLPPTLHFTQPNPQIDFANSPFVVNTRLTEWTGPEPRLAGLSSFGFGGTNTHVILQEAPRAERSGESRPWQLLTVSARSAAALEKATDNLVAYLRKNPQVPLADVAYTLQVGRRDFDHRRVLVCRTVAEAAEALEKREPERVLTSVREGGERPFVFMFPGQGTQHVDMARELYETEPVFREEVERCAGLLRPHLGLDLRTVLYPEPGKVEDAARQLEQTALTQPALFVIEYALARLWMSWGIQPQALIGHSIGEYVAACLAGVFSLEDALQLVATRGKLMQQVPPGAMLSVPLSEQDVRPLLGERLDLAAVNGPALCVVAGPTEAVEALREQLAARNVQARRLHTSHAFHSAMMEPLLATFTDTVRRVRLHPPKIPLVSNVTGTWLTPEQATDPRYWAQHLRQPVLFSRGLGTLLEEPGRVLLEVGPGQVSSTFARQQPAAAGRLVLASMRHPQQQESDAAFLRTTLGRLWLAGLPVAWKDFHARERRQRLPLPTYPFERQRYWVEPTQGAQTLNVLQSLQEWTHKRRALGDWFYLPGWKQSLLPASQAAREPQRWLVFTDASGPGQSLVQRLAKEGHDVLTVTPGTGFAWQSERACTIDPRRREDYAALLKELDGSGRSPGAIAHLWSALSGETNPGGQDFFDRCQALGFNSLLFLAQAIGERARTEPLQLAVITHQLQEVDSGDVPCPEKATVLGACRVIPREYPHLTCRTIDVGWPTPGTPRESQWVEQLVAELTGPSSEPAVAWRGRNRWVQTFEPFRLEEPAGPMRRLRQGGRYLLTGGLGGIGLVLAESLARTAQARLVLVGRSAFPAREAWEQWLATHDAQDAVSVKIRKLKELEAAGAEVLVASADVANLEQMRAVLNQVRERWGGLDGVIHAAGVAGGGLIQLKTPEAASQIMAPKVQGVRVLDTLLRDTPLDFLVLFSSITSFVGEMGQSDYCAANAYLDAYARSVSQRGTFAVAINWDMWHGAGMAVDSQLPPALKAWREVQLKLAIRGEEGTDALRRILAGDVSPQVIVSTTNLQELLDQVRAFSQTNLLAELGRSATPGVARPRPALATAHVAPRNDIERALADIWKTLLGLEEVGVHDSFFELGGHSLLATQLRNHISSTFKVDPPLRSLFEKPTVAGIAALLEKELGRNAAAQEKPISERLRTAFPTERQGVFEDYLRRKIAKVFNRTPEQLPADGSLAGMDLQQLGAELEYDLKQDFKFQLFPHEVHEHPHVPDLARYLLAEMERAANPTRFLTDKPLAAWPLRPYRKHAAGPAVRRANKNPGMVFVHSSPRSGSTLLRVMLAGHPRLFCPPELNLLFFETLKEWRENVGFGHQMDWTEGGLKWALMELLGLDSTAGQARLDQLVAENMSTQDVYARLQELAGPRLLVDKTPPYSMDPETLRRAEAMFDRPKHIYLYRHPYPVMESILRVRMDRLFGPSLFGEAAVDPHVVAETVWALPNRNLLDFFAGIEKERCLWVRYEDLVANPAAVMTRVCEFLDIPFDERVLQPYDGKRERMMGGLGDPNILQHNRIESDLGESWKRIKWPRPLDASTRELVTRLGYRVEEPAPPPRPSAVEMPESATEAELLAKLEQLPDDQVAALLAELSAGKA